MGHEPSYAPAPKPEAVQTGPGLLAIGLVLALALVTAVLLITGAVGLGRGNGWQLIAGGVGGLGACVWLIRALLKRPSGGVQVSASGIQLSPFDPMVAWEDVETLKIDYPRRTPYAVGRGVPRLTLTRRQGLPSPLTLNVAPSALRLQQAVDAAWRRADGPAHVPFADLVSQEDGGAADTPPLIATPEDNPVTLLWAALTAVVVWLLIFGLLLGGYVLTLGVHGTSPRFLLGAPAIFASGIAGLTFVVAIRKVLAHRRRRNQVLQRNERF